MIARAAPAVQWGWDCAGPTPEPAWLEATWRIAPRTDSGHDWLLLRWEPGERWAPIERWYLWSMTPIERTPRSVLASLFGPDPRRFGYYDRVLGRFVSRYRGCINTQQWRLFQQYHCFPQPLWIVQGWDGGHKRGWTPIEQQLSELRGGPSEPPRGGELPYAEPDNRTFAWLRQLDAVAKYGDLLGRLYSEPARIAALDRRDRAVAAEAAIELSNWLDENISGALDLSYRQAAAIRGMGTRDKAPLDGDEVNHSFINTVTEAFT